ncbi:MAG: nitroreductase family protein [Promethearchaeota archaeon]
MPITGIDFAKCSICKQCIKECPTNNYSLDEKRQKVVYNLKSCILCGHCIAVCPEDAILYENMKSRVFAIEDPTITTSQKAIHNLIASKRSIRRYKNKEVPQDVLDKVFDSMKYAPTAMNLRTLKCRLISGNQEIKEFSMRIIDTIESEKERKAYKDRLEEGKNPFFYDAPHILILHSKDSWGVVNATITITYAMLYAETLGLGSCWIGGIQQYLVESKERTKKILGISDRVCGIMILGYPAVKYYRVPPRAPIRVKTNL